ncbi:MAG: glycosyltransferase family 4 protein [Bacteroidetes bacterium]|nr:glycosyltransferase family 4 protein [Bacteroidota bacterium]
MKIAVNTRLLLPDKMEGIGWIAFEYYPEYLPFAEKKNYRHYFPRFARRADKIATVSAFSKQDISRLYGIPQEKVDVVYDGANDVLTSNVSSMPEVAGDAALYADPSDISSISEQLEKLAIHEPLRKELIRKGFERQYLFTWQKTADKLWACIEKTMNP